MTYKTIERENHNKKKQISPTPFHLSKTTLTQTQTTATTVTRTKRMKCQQASYEAVKLPAIHSARRRRRGHSKFRQKRK